MENNNVLRLIRTFSRVELRDVRKFLLSPFFNQREDLVRLFDWLCAENAPDRPATWKYLNGREPYDEQKLRLLLSYLHTLLEQYISVRELLADRLNTQLHLAKGYRRRRLDAAFVRATKNLEKSLENQDLRNAAYHEIRYQLEWEAHQQAYPNNPTDLSHLNMLTQEVDVIYLSQKLRHICLITAHQAVYPTAMPALNVDEVLGMATARPELAALPAVAIYLNCYQMLRYPEQEAHFLTFKRLLLEQSGRFSEEEMHGLYILALNYCVRRINAADYRFSKELLDLYKAGLGNGYLFENGVLTRFAFNNIVAVGLHTGESDWVYSFIHEYKNRLEKRYRDSSFSFSLARVEYARRNFGAVLDLLQKANYRDPLLNLAAKTLLLKTYFELGEHEPLQSHLDAMRNYINRKRVIGYHRANYLNTVRYAEKLIRLQPGDRRSATALREAVDQEEVLQEKVFFQKLLDDVIQ